MNRFGFVGRRAEIARVGALLDEGVACATVWGGPGVGKSALLREIASSPRWAARVVRLGSEASLDAVLARVQRALGVGAQRDDAVAFASVVDLLSSSSSPLFVDAGTAAVDVVRELVSVLVEECPTSRVVVAARVPLRLSFEHLVPLGPLPLADTCELLERRLSQQQRPAPSAGAVARIAEISGGIPLAVELLASQVAAVGADVVLQAGDDGGALEPLEHALRHGWAQLSEEDRRSLAKLTVFRAPFSAVAASKVLGLEARPTIALLSRAVDAAFVRLAPGGEAFTLGGAVRAFVESTAGELPAATRDAHARYVATEDERDQAARDEWVLAWRWCTRAEGGALADAALALASKLDAPLLLQGPPALHREVLERTLELHPEHPRLLACLGRQQALQGANEDALRSLASAARAAERRGEIELQALCDARLGFAYRSLGRLDEGVVATVRAERMAQRAQSWEAECGALEARGVIELAQGRGEAARETLARGLSLARLAAVPRTLGIAHANVGLAEYLLGDLSRGRAELELALAIFDEIPDHRLAARARAMLTALRVDAGDAPSEGEIRATQSGCVAWGDREGELMAQLALARRAARAGDVDLARQRLADYDLLFERSALGLHPLPPESLREELSARAASDGRRRVLRLDARGNRVEVVGDAAIDLSRRGALRRILLALVESQARGAPISVSEAREIGWPNEKMLPESGAARVYMAVRRLRLLGLEAVLVTSDEGYALAPDVVVERAD